MKLILDHLARATRGRLHISLPDGSHVEFGEQDLQHLAHMTINDYRFFSRVALGSDIGFGRSLHVR